jgi:hypothetical protein|nr:hypothetical protein [Neorhizobium tomejilense]
MRYEEITLYQELGESALKAAEEVDLKCRGLANDAKGCVSKFLAPFRRFHEPDRLNSSVELDVLLTIFGELGQPSPERKGDVAWAFEGFVRRCLNDIESDRRHVHQALRSALQRVHAVCISHMTRA